MKKIFPLMALAIFALAGVSHSQEVKINSNLAVESDGTLRFDDAATVWNDLMVFPDATSKGSSNAPTWAQFKNNGGSQGVWLWWFSPTTEQEVYFTIQIPHNYKLGSELHPHVHWTTSSGTPTRNNVVWGFEYTVTSIGSTFGPTNTLTTTGIIDAITPSGDGQHLISSFPAILGTGLGISSVIVGRLFRKVSDTEHTFNQTVGLLGFDIHYEQDTQGSRTEYQK